MAKNKTSYNEVNVTDFVNSYVDNDQKKTDTFHLIDLFKKWTGFEPQMYGPSIIGFGNYDYKYASGHEGSAPIVAFSPRKPALTLYVYSPTEKSKLIIENLGKYKMTKGCIYVKKLSDIDLSVLEVLCQESIQYINEHHQCGCKDS